MTALRNWLCFLVPLVLCSACNLAFAQSVPIWTGAGGMVWRAPNGTIGSLSNPTWEGFSNGSGGGVNANMSQSASVGGRSLTANISRGVGARGLARSATQFVKRFGPAGFAFGTAIAMVWDELDEEWEVEEPGSPGAFTYHVIPSGPWRSTKEDACLAVYPSTDWASNITSDGYGGWESGYCLDNSAGYWQTLGTWERVCPGTQVDGVCYTGDPVRRAATDLEIEDAIYTELVSRGMGSDLARRLVEAGYEPALIENADPNVISSGPSSVPGQTTTSTTSGPAGQTQTVTQTTYNIDYNQNTITITPTTVTTTTAPDGQTTTTTETTSPDGDGPTETPTDEKPFCELYPNSSACQELGDPQDEELPEETETVSWGQEGSASGWCPASIPFWAGGTAQSLSWQPTCDFASGIRPFVIGIAWLSAGLFLLSIASRKS